jgi:amidase
MLASSERRSLWAAAAAVLLACQGSFTAAQRNVTCPSDFAARPFPPLLDATLEDLACGLGLGMFTSVDLVEAYVARIGEVNSTLRMVTELNPDARQIAADLDAERARGGVRGPLHGIPMLLKNNIATNDKMGNTAGSYALLGAKVPEDSTVAAKLRRAGVVLLGKTNLSQWANFRSLNTSNGWSAYGGQTQGAYFPGQDPSGSSSGSGVASSLGLAFASLGTETDGSIVSPSQANNIVGIKPTVGLTSRYLVVPISEHQDTVGPMARTVKDAAYILFEIAGKDQNDNYTSAIPGNTIPDYVAACKDTALQGKRIGVPGNLIAAGRFPEPVLAAFRAALDTIREAGAEVVDDITLPGVELLTSSPVDFELNVLEADFITNLAGYMAKLSVNPFNITTVAQLQDFTRNSTRESFPERDTGIWQQAIELGYGNDSPEFFSNYSMQLELAGPQGLTGALRNLSLDALVVPTGVSSGLPALIGAPVVTVPLGRMPDNTTVTRNRFGNLNATSPNFPFGIAFMAEHFAEERLVGIAYAFEQRTKVRKTIVPYLQPRTEVQIKNSTGTGQNNAGVGRAERIFGMASAAATCVALLAPLLV